MLELKQHLLLGMLIENPNISNMDDKELVALALKEKENYEYLMQRYEARLLRYIIRLSGVRKEDAEDILQESFLKVYKNLNGYDPKLNFSSWIYRITHNEAITHLRRRKARPKIADTEDSNLLMDFVKSDPGFGADVEKKYLAEDLGKVIDSLDKKYREVIVLIYLEEKSYKEVSDIIKKPIGTIATLLSRAKKQLRNKIINNKKF